MGMKLRDEMRIALEPVPKAMSRAIRELRELGRFELADELDVEYERWISIAKRGVRRVSPRGRVVAPPIAPLPTTSPLHRPPVGVEEWKRHVELLRARYTTRATPPPLRLTPTSYVRNEQETPDAAG